MSNFLSAAIYYQNIYSCMNTYGVQKNYVTFFLIFLWEVRLYLKQTYLTYLPVWGISLWLWMMSFKKENARAVLFYYIQVVDICTCLFLYKMPCCDLFSVKFATQFPQHFVTKDVDVVLCPIYSCVSFLM